MNKQSVNEAVISGKASPLKKALLAAFAALMLSTAALAPQAGAQVAPADQRAVSGENEANGLPVSYTDARGHKAFQCLSDQALCAIEDPNAIGEVVYWAGETSMPVGKADARGRQGQASLVMSVEGAYESPATFTDPITGSVILVKADGLRPNTVYKVSHPYGNFQVRTNGDGEFPRNRNTLAEAGCDIEPGGECDFGLALESPVFNNFLRWDTGAPAGYYGDPEVNHKVVGSLVKNAAGKPQNYFRIEGPAAGGAGKAVKTTARFSVAGQKFQDTTTVLAPPEEAAAE